MNQHKPISFPTRLFVCLVSASTLLVGATSSKGSPSPSRSSSPKAGTKRLSVLDYYYILPSLGIGYSATRREKKLTLAYNHPVIDTKRDYMNFQPDSSPREQLAVFRARGQADLVAESMPDFDSDYNFFALYRLEHGRLKDVTDQVLPVPARTGVFAYELPRVGTTIRVYRFDLDKQTHHHAFDLRWHQGRFVKVNLR